MKNKLPENIAVFPLSNAVFFPKTVLPLNIFENRYIQLVSDCMKENRMFGMIQPKTQIGQKPEVYQVGCLGKITSFNETKDNRFIINLSGISRFRIKEEIKSNKNYREFKVDYSDFQGDLETTKIEKNYNLKQLLIRAKILFEKRNFLIDWNEVEKLNIDQLIPTICMISPFSIQEKQKLIETVRIEDNIGLLEELINLNILDNLENKTIQ
jgi:uncharacterized protein|tara:strand:- start:1047 stop:1679 length:633 start_codon:yes stop_codon:yes gene_type:complete